MFNPRQYLIRLQLLYVAARCCGEAPQGSTGVNGIENEVPECDARVRLVDDPGAFVCGGGENPGTSGVIAARVAGEGHFGYDFVYQGNQIFVYRENEGASPNSTCG